MGGEGAGERRGHRDAGGGGGEVLHRQPGHLGEVGERRLAPVALPVGVGDEAHGRVEGQVRGHAREVQGIERQEALKPEDGVEEEEARRVEAEERARVAEPALAARRVDAGRGVEQPLHRTHHRIEPGAFTLPDPRHVGAERPAERQRQPQRPGDIRPPLPCHRDVIRIRTCRGGPGRRPCRCRSPAPRWRRRGRSWRHSIRIRRP